MRIWWLEDFARLRAEKAAVERMASQEGWFTLTAWRPNEFRFSADGVITAHGIAYPVRLIYPDQFPLVPAWVEPQDPDDRWSDHQYGKGGPLCLELRPDNWHPDATGADVLRSAFNLLSAENPLGEIHDRVTSEHQVGDVQSYDWGQNPVLISAGCLARMCAGTAQSVSALRWSADDDVWPVMIFDAEDRARPQHPPSFDLGTLRLEVPVVVGHAETVSEAPADRETLARELGVELEPERHASALMMVAIAKSGAQPFHSPDPASVFPRKWVVLPEQAGLRSGRAVDTAGKLVGIVGLGSVGSKLAEMLVRSGVHRLLLIDGDVLLPANLERHTLDWRDIGFRKAHAVKRRLLHIVPGASIATLAINLNWQHSARAHASNIGHLAACDLIVDATGDVPSSLMLGALAAENAKPFVSAEVFEGGLGCLLARSIPEHDPAYGAGRAAYTAYCDEQGIAPPAAGPRTYEALTTAGEPLVADDAAATMTAAHAARIALDILDERIGHEDAAWLLIGFRAGWLFTRHGQTISLNVGGPPPVGVPSDDPEMREFASAIATEALRAAKAS